MNTKHSEFDLVSVEQNNRQSLIVFEVNQISSVVRQTNIGQFIRSCPFELNFPATIGKSEWIVILFPNGQYVAGQPNDMIDIYLKLVHCEHQSVQFKFDVTFQLGWKFVKITKKNNCICYSMAQTRWIGTGITNNNAITDNESGFIQDDVLRLSAHIDEHLPSTESHPDYSNESFVKEPYLECESDYMELPSLVKASSADRLDKGERMNMDHVSSAEAAYNFWINKEQLNKTEPFRNTSSPNRKNPFVKTEVGDLPQYSSPQSTIQSNNVFGLNEPSHLSHSVMRRFSTNRSDSVECRNIIRDSNLDYIHKEFSDDEDAAEKSTIPKNPLFSMFRSFWNQMKK